MANKIEKLLDGVAANLNMAWWLVGRSVKIPTWEALVWTWHDYQRRAVIQSFDTQTDGEEIGRTVMSQGSQTDFSTIPIPGKVSIAATANELCAHEAAQVTLNRGVVMLATKKIRQSQSDKPAPYQTQCRIRKISEYEEQDLQTSSVLVSVSPSVRQPSIKMKLTRVVSDILSQGVLREYQNHDSTEDSQIPTTPDKVTNRPLEAEDELLLL